MKVAVIIPCLNEAAAIAGVVVESRKYLPQAEVYVLDNASDDNTAEMAARAGAQVIHSPLRGKGNVIRHAMRVIDADYYIMVDGDGTYPLAEAGRLLELAHRYNYDMVTGTRLESGEPGAFRRFHFFGNRLLTGLVRTLFRFPVRDLLTGYRVFSRRFAEEVQILSRGFEVETELTIRAIAQDLPFCEVPIPYNRRVAGGASKLRTFRDGWVILRTVLRYWRIFHPLPFFTLPAAGCAALLALGVGGDAWRSALSLTGVGLFTIGVYANLRSDWQRVSRRSSSAAAPGRDLKGNRRSA